MNNSVACQFKRNVDADNNPTGDWEPGMAFEFVVQGQYATQSAIISSTNTAETLIIPLNRVSFAAGNPDVIKAAWVKAEATAKSLKEARVKSGLDPTGNPVVHPIAATHVLPAPAPPVAPVVHPVVPPVVAPAAPK
jgi:hypothetical protein